jgi:signal transduction histidine kinase/CheY-like chemotaxis protein/HPt (histidine-containing phosphotransfer) domain-containing protein
MNLFKAYSRLSLRTKVTGLALVISTTALAIVATTGIVQMRAQIEAEQYHSADSVALGIARASELPLTVGDSKEMSRLANSFLRNPEILFIAAYTDRPEPLVITVRDQAAWDSFRNGATSSANWLVGQSVVDAPSEIDEFGGDPADPSETHLKNSAGKKVPAGRIVVGLSTAASQHALAEQSRLILSTTCAAASIGALFLFVTLGAWMRRLQRLDVAAQSIARGDFTKSIDDTRDDEIGRLSHSFEEMRHALLERDRQLRRFTETLQQQVEQRTHDLEVALATAKEANHAKSLFLANMSHELRTPLNGVIGMVNLLLATPTTPQQRRYCDVAKVSARSLLELINDILDFSKIEAGKLELDATDFDLHEAVESVTQMLGERAEKQKLELICSITPDVPRAVHGDPVRLRQVIMNLISNALKFTEQGEVVVTIVTLEQTDAEAIVKVSVRDTGVGIPKDRLDRLFKSFSQVDASTTRKYGGTGLGLAISLRIVEMMSGKMGVESVEGKGSTFWFTAKLRKRAELTPADLGRTDPRGIRVLAVDDNATNREILEAQLASWQVRADLAGDAEQAIAMMRQATASGDPYRIAILDMHMPGVDGGQLARTVKSDPATRDVILISLSSIGDQIKPSERGPLGFSACLTKPVLPSSLYDAIVGSLASNAQQKAASPNELIEVDHSMLGGVRVLLAEDHEVNRMVAAELLQQAGCELSMAVNGREAVDFSAREAFDVILMDCQMPEVDGFAATKLIREREKASARPTHIPIIALTANAIKGDRELCLAAGMDAYVTKPIEPMELFKAIGEALGQNRWPRRAAKTPAEIHASQPASPSYAATVDPGSQTSAAQGPSSAPASSALASAAPASVAHASVAQESAAESSSVRASPNQTAAQSSGQPASDQSPPIDFESLSKRCLGNRALAVKALEKFVGSLDAYVEDLSVKLRNPDLFGAAAAHKLKGAAANLSAEQVRRLAADMETLIKGRSIDQAEASFNELKIELDRLREYVATSLKAVAARGGTSPAQGKINA